MIAQRAFYSASIADFRESTPEQILGTIVANSSITLEHTQRNAWVEEIQILKEVMSTYEGQVYAYRVLLTRARQGMIIVVPPGDRDDPTRHPQFYNPTFTYLVLTYLMKSSHSWPGKF